MTKPKRNRIIEGAKQAVEVAKCKHELIPQPQPKSASKFDRFYCLKCRATFWEPSLMALMTERLDDDQGRR